MRCARTTIDRRWDHRALGAVIDDVLAVVVVAAAVVVQAVVGAVYEWGLFLDGSFVFGGLEALWGCLLGWVWPVLPVVVRALVYADRGGADVLGEHLIVLGITDDAAPSRAAPACPRGTRAAWYSSSMVASSSLMSSLLHWYETFLLSIRIADTLTEKTLFRE